MIWVKFVNWFVVVYFYWIGIDWFFDNGVFSWYYLKFMGFEDFGKIYVMNKKVFIVLKVISYF